MTHVPYVRHAEVAASHLGDRAPVNTCVKLGMRAWPNELGLEDLDTDSVSEAERRARAGYKGWSYHEGTGGIRVGFYADWKPSVLGGDGTNRHVCVVDQHDGDRWRGIGAGTPSGLVAHQPQSGGTNSLSVLQGYFIPPTETAAPTRPAAPTVKPAAASSSGTITVVKGDTVDGLARRHRTTRAAILRANPAGSARRAADFRIVNANRIYVGQRLHIPT